jgi:beta-lactamase class A
MRILRSIRLLIAFGSLCLPGPLAFAQNLTADPPKESPARAQVEQLIQQAGAEVSIAFRSLDGAQELFVAADKQFRAANTTIKIPVMIELYAQAQAGELRLSETIPIHNGFSDLLTGDVYQLDPKNDPDPDLFKSIGGMMTLGDLCDRMVKKNSDLAADLLIEKLGVERIRQRIRAMHADGIEFRTGFGDDPAKQTIAENTASARGLMELLWALVNASSIGSDASDLMMGIIANSTTSGDPAGLPADARATQLTASVVGVQHEELIVFGAHSFVLVMIVSRGASPAAGSALMAQITHALVEGMQQSQQ